MSLIEKFLWIEAGIICSLALPFARAILAPILPRGNNAARFSVDWPWVGQIAWKYLKYFFATLVLSAVLTMLSGTVGYTITTEENAFLVGFISDSIIAKFTRERLIGSGGSGTPGPPPSDA